MPVVSKKKMFVDATLREVEMIVKYSSENANFSAELPAPVVEKLMREKKY